MSLNTILTYAQLGSAIVLIITILMQQRGGGIGGALGGSSMEFSSKRGIEKGIFYASIVVAIMFIATSIIRLVLPA